MNILVVKKQSVEIPEWLKEVKNLHISDSLPSQYQEYTWVCCLTADLEKLFVKQQTLSVKQGLVLKKILLEDIFYFRAEQKYIMIRHKEGDFIIQDTIKQLSAKYSDTFIQIHRKYLVAKNKISSLVFEPIPYVRLEHLTEPLPVSRRQLTTIKKFLGD